MNTLSRLAIGAFLLAGSAFAQNPNPCTSVNNSATNGQSLTSVGGGSAPICTWATVSGAPGPPGPAPSGTGIVVVNSGVASASNSPSITGGYTSGSGANTSGITQWNGATSGGQAIGAAAVAGSPILYLIPATAGTTGQVLQDTGSTTCPALPAGAPATCHQMAWVAMTGVTVQSQNLGSNTTTGWVGNGSRVLGTTYHNTLSVALDVSVSCTVASSSTASQMYAVSDANSTPTQIVALNYGPVVLVGQWTQITFKVIPGNYYVVNGTNCDTSTSTNGTDWVEYH